MQLRRTTRNFSVKAGWVVTHNSLLHRCAESREMVIDKTLLNAVDQAAERTRRNRSTKLHRAQQQTSEDIFETRSVSLPRKPMMHRYSLGLCHAGDEINTDPSNILCSTVCRL